MFSSYLYSALQCSQDMHAVAAYTQVQVEDNLAVGEEQVVQVLRVAVLNNLAVLGKQKTSS